MHQLSVTSQTLSGGIKSLLCAFLSLGFFLPSVVSTLRWFQYLVRLSMARFFFFFIPILRLFPKRQPPNFHTFRFVFPERRALHGAREKRRETLLSIPRTHWWKVLDQGRFIRPHFRAAKRTKFLVKQDDVVISRFLIGSRYSVRKELLSCFYLSS